MKRLMYDKISEGVIGVDLNNGYTVVALRRWSKSKGCYVVCLYLKDNKVDILDLMLDDVRVPVDKKEEKIVNSAIAQTVTDLFKNGELDYYIGRYKYSIFNGLFYFWQRLLF